MPTSGHSFFNQIIHNDMMYLKHRTKSHQKARKYWVRREIALNKCARRTYLAFTLPPDIEWF